MKKNLFLALSLALTFPLTSMAADVTKATTLKITSPDGLTDVKNLKVKLSANCSYKSGIFMPESKGCGSSSVELKVEADGSVKVPAVQTLKGYQASKVGNYEVSLSIYDGNQYLAILGARGKEGLSRFKLDSAPLAIYRLNAANINVSHEGADFFGSDLSKVDRAIILVSIKDKNKPTYAGDVLVVNSLEGQLWARENFDSYAGKVLLKDVTSIDLPKLAYAKFGGTGNETLVISAHYSIPTDYKKEKSLSGSVEVALKASALEEVGTIELKKK